MNEKHAHAIALLKRAIALDEASDALNTGRVIEQTQVIMAEQQST